MRNVTPKSPPLQYTRRRALRLAGAGVCAVVLSGCGDDTGGTVSADASGSSGCVKTPGQDVGSFYVADTPERVDITDGQEGSLLELNLTVIDASSCLPVGGAMVELWHANAAGEHSGVASNGNSEPAAEQFLRGVQITDGNGTVRFTSIYPGWLAGRTTHLNMRVSVESEERITTQLSFPDDVSSEVYTTHEAYLDRGDKETTNDTDPNGGSLARLRMDVIAANTGHFATHTIGIDR